MYIINHILIIPCLNFFLKLTGYRPRLYVAENATSYVTCYMYIRRKINLLCLCWLVGFVALRPKSTAMVIAGRSVHLATLFHGQA